MLALESFPVMVVFKKMHILLMSHIINGFIFRMIVSHMVCQIYLKADFKMSASPILGVIRMSEQLSLVHVIF